MLSMKVHVLPQCMHLHQCMFTPSASTHTCGASGFAQVGQLEGFNCRHGNPWAGQLYPRCSMAQLRAYSQMSRSLSMQTTDSTATCICDHSAIPAGIVVRYAMITTSLNIDGSEVGPWMHMATHG